MADSPPQPPGPPSASPAHLVGIPRLQPACRATLTLRGGTLWRHRPLYAELVRRAKEQGLAGAHVLHAIEGFSPGGPVVHHRTFGLRDRLPLCVVIVDDRPAVDRFLGSLDPRMRIDSIVLDRVYQLTPHDGTPRTDKE
ncbi:DUF190 domain-containing protein [Streptomyces tricolor]|uniref:DUF190 domain-containing protein n=1 Tax=Streptomyces tricolor TaxID=68277 RepID=UPI00381555AF